MNENEALARAAGLTETQVAALHTWLQEQDPASAARMLPQHLRHIVAYRQTGDTVHRNPQVWALLALDAPRPRA